MKRLISSTSAMVQINDTIIIPRSAIIEVSLVEEKSRKIKSVLLKVKTMWCTYEFKGKAATDFLKSEFPPETINEIKIVGK